MNKKSNINLIYKAAAVVLSLVLLLNTGCIEAFATALPLDETSVSENTLSDVNDNDFEEADDTDSDVRKEQDEETNDPDEDEMLSDEEFVGADWLDPESTPLSYDAFYRTNTIKGYLGSEAYGCKHVLLNWNIIDWLDTDDRIIATNPGNFSNAVSQTYNGKTFYFNPEDFRAQISEFNRKGITVSVCLLNPHRSSRRRFYYPAAESMSHDGLFAWNIDNEDNRDELYALFNYLASVYTTSDCHVDNWILGNEVNVPNTWNKTGTSDPGENVRIYKTGYQLLYNAVKSKSSYCRVSVSIDHAWNSYNDGKGFPAMEFLDRFYQSVGNSDWTIAYHPYPGDLTDSRIWIRTNNPDSVEAAFVDGANISVLTNYVKTHFGSKHRIMCTEFGATMYRGLEAQAACLSYTYYACKYNDMIDCLIYNNQIISEAEYYNIYNKPAGTCLSLIDTNNVQNALYIAGVCLPAMGVNDWNQLIPGFSEYSIRNGVEGFVDRLYRNCLGREPDGEGRTMWIRSLYGAATGAQVGYGFFMSDEMAAMNLSNAEYVDRLYRVMLNRVPDANGAAGWVSALDQGVGRDLVYAGFANSEEFRLICGSYGVERGIANPVQARSMNPNLTYFINRLYVNVLGRNGDPDGLNGWCAAILNGQCGPDHVATNGFFHSQEFINAQLNNDQFIDVLYHTFFGREPDPQGKADWLNALNNGATADDVIAGFCNSVEFANIKASFGL